MIDIKELEERFDKLFETETEKRFNDWLEKEKAKEYAEDCANTVSIISKLENA